MFMKILRLDLLSNYYIYKTDNLSRIHCSKQWTVLINVPNILKNTHLESYFLGINTNINRFMNRNILFFIFTLSIIQSGFSQKGDWIKCATDQLHEQNMQNPEYAKQFKELKKMKEVQQHQHTSATICATPLVVPVAIHYGAPITVANTTCLIDAAQEQIDQMNDDYRMCNANSSDYCNFLNACPSYFSDPNGGEVIPEDGVCIQFCIGNQNLPSGEDNIGGLAITVGDYTWPSVPGNTWDGFFNIFVSNEATAGQANGTLGIAPLNGAANPNGNGVWVLMSTFGSATFSGCTSGGTIGNNTTFSGGATLTHEAGHYFGLDHTFSDNLADTPPQSQPNYGCPTTNTTNCTTSVGSDYGFNFMDYVDDECMSIFSEDQANIMTTIAASQTMWETNSISCYTGWTNGTTVFSSCQGYCSPNTAPPIASFTPENNAAEVICSGGCIDFIDSSTDSPTSWSWTFTVNSGDIVLDISSSALQSPSLCVTSGTSGNITASLTATNANGSSTVSHSVGITAETCTEYCNNTSAAIPDADATGITQDINIPVAGTIIDIDFSADISHTYVGDLIITLSHAGTTITIIDRPGFPSSTYGCGNNNIDCTFDDESVNGTVENVCNGTNPAYSGDYEPEQALSVFDGLDQAGIWTITVSDNEGQDTGTLDEWCLDITTSAGTVSCLSMAQLFGEITGVEDYESSDFIESTQTLLNGSAVDYDAVNSVLLDVGFEVESNVNFEAFIDGCNNGSGGVNVNGTFTPKSK